AEAAPPREAAGTGGSRPAAGSEPAEAAPARDAAPAAPAAQPAPPEAAPAPRPSVGAGEREERVVPMTPIRRRIAERLVQARAEAALLTTFNQVDMSAVAEIRERYGKSFQERHGVRLGLM